MMVKVKKVEREIEGTTYIVKLYKDDKHPEKNRFDFEGEKYSLIIRTPKPVPGPPASPRPSIHENVETILRIVRRLEEKTEAT